MKRISFSSFSVATVIALATLSGCSEATDVPTVGDEITNLDGESFLSDHDSLYAGWPGNDNLADEGKADAHLPQRYTDLANLQSPIRSQAKRGVCSIFSAVGLMEHLYVKEGSIPNPDFSEEFLQWSAKEEVRSFRNSEGSNSNYNLQAISTYGIVNEGDWPYLGRKWNTSDDPDCEGDAQPTKCYTHGDPPQSALDAKRWKLPRSRWISSRAQSIKAHMFSQQEAVIVGGIFFYQSWNHRTSTLPTNNAYWRKGYVTAPNSADESVSREKRAGHSFVLIGWDDDLEVQMRDGEGNLRTDDNGEPMMEKGFFLFKNSWGTASFGVENEFGPGYGWISMDYISTHLAARISGMPTVDVAREICGNGIDDNNNGLTDCEEIVCGDLPACQETASESYSNEESVSIPDNEPAGASSEITVHDGGSLSSVQVEVAIAHSYRGDLRLILSHGGTEVVLVDRKGGSRDDIRETFDAALFAGTDAAGAWQLRVVDTAGADVGQLEQWTLHLTK